MVPPVFKTGLAAIAVAGGFDSLPPPPSGSTTRSQGKAVSAGPFIGRMLHGILCHVGKRQDVLRATLLRRRKWTDDRGNLYEVILWKVERSRRYPEGVRYRLAFIRSGEEIPALLYDNHHPKGHHRHVGDREEPYPFTTVRQLVADFVTGARALAGGSK